MDMSRISPLALVALVLFAPVSAYAQSDGGSYDIMRPEPWLPPKYQSPRGLPQQVKPVRPMEAPPRAANPPPPIVVPQTGAVLPNMPTLSPSGPGGRETYQDRAVRCAHQASAYGEAAGDRTNYINTCINQ
jgi:hypothetical protein